MKDTNDNHDQAVAYKAVVEKLWAEPVFDACRDQLPTPEDATVLVAEVRCGYVPIELAGMSSDSTRIMALDSHSSMLDVARKRAEGASGEDRIYFVAQQVGDLSYADDVFQAGICLDGICTIRQARQGVAELTRVTVGGGKVVVAAPLASSFPEFYDMLDEALRAHELADVLPRAGQLDESFLGVGDLAGAADAAGLDDISIEKIRWKLSFDSGRDFLHSPLVRSTFFPQWLGVIRSAEREPVLRYISDAIDTYWHGQEFVTAIEAAVLVGRA
jgi:SAM-dependent methyltransferase